MQIHLIRHGHVENPGDFVYADIPGFRLSKTGRSQASAAGDYLSQQSLRRSVRRSLRRSVRRIISSPLDRAVETATLIAAATGADVLTDAGLTEWLLAVRWRGATWKQLPSVFPGELEAYLARPDDLPFSPESLEQLGDRLVAAITRWTDDGEGAVAFVSHEDPLHAAYLRLTGATPDLYHRDKPKHCSVTTLESDGSRWITARQWAPPY
jgi:broad specificity phosphatase PhoE